MPVENGERSRRTHVVQEGMNADQVDRIVAFALRNADKRLRDLYYTIWKLLSHIERQDARLRRSKSPTKGEGEGEIEEHHVRASQGEGEEENRMRVTNQYQRRGEIIDYGGNEL